MGKLNVAFDGSLSHKPTRNANSPRRTSARLSSALISISSLDKSSMLESAVPNLVGLAAVLPVELVVGLVVEIEGAGLEIEAAA